MRILILLIAVVSFSIQAQNITVSSGKSCTVDKTGSVQLYGNLTNNGTFTLNSDSNEYASVIVDSDNNGSGTNSTPIVYNRFVNEVGAGEWDLIGAPLDAQSISSFATTNTAGTAILVTSGVYYALGTYDSSDDTWTNFTSSSVSSAGNFDIGKGYQAGTLSGGGLLKFIGTAAADHQTQSIQYNVANDLGGSRWNLIANPFPSYIKANTHAHSTNNFLTVNNSDIQRPSNITIPSRIDPNFLAIYGWESDTNGDNTGAYTIYNFIDSEPLYIAPGQGFFIAANPNLNDTDFFPDATDRVISFTKEMRTIVGGDDFIAGRMMNPTSSEFLLKLYEEDTFINSTRFYFDNGLTLGMDPGYDAGAFEQDFGLMSRLPESDQGIGLAINAMGLEAFNAISIPLEVYQVSNVPFRISLEDSTIASDIEVQLEDRLLETLTLLNDEDFTLTAEEDLSGIGRFYLHLGNVTLGDNTFIQDLVSIYKGINDNYITLEGLPYNTKNNLNVYNVLGQLVLSNLLEANQTRQTVSTKGLPSGIYLVELQSGRSILSKKIIVK